MSKSNLQNSSPAAAAKSPVTAPNSVALAPNSVALAPNSVAQITRAVILAAGTGSRLRAGGNECPKPLRPVGGVPLLTRVLRTLKSAQVREVVVVVGYEGERIKRAIRAESLGLEIEFVDNKNYLAKNGISVLSAAQFIDRECYLSMSDHLYEPVLVERLARANVPVGDCALGVDYDIPRCFDLDDATKVRVATRGQSERIVDIAKELATYDALDTGVFRIGPSLIEELSVVASATGDCSLSDGVKALSAKGRFWACDVGAARWLDVDTPESAIEAERLLKLYGDDLSGRGEARRSPNERSIGVPPRVREIATNLWHRALSSATFAEVPLSEPSEPSLSEPSLPSPAE